MAKRDKEFFKQMVCTQLYNLHLEDQLVNLTEEAEQSKVLSVQLEQQIGQLELRKISALAKAKYYQLEAAEVQDRITVLKEVHQSLQATHKKKTQSSLKMISSSLDILKKSLNEKQ